MPEASSSAPGAVRHEPSNAIESRWPPITTTSPGRVVPGMVMITDFWA